LGSLTCWQVGHILMGFSTLVVSLPRPCRILDVGGGFFVALAEFADLLVGLPHPHGVFKFGSSWGFSL